MFSETPPAHQPGPDLPCEPHRIRGVIVWPGNDLTAQRRIALGERQRELAAIGHQADCWCEKACRPHRLRIAQLRSQLDMPPAR